MDLQDCIKVVKRDRRYVLGMLSDGRAAIWDRRVGGRPLQTYDRLDDAWEDFDPRPQRSGARSWLTFAVVLVVLVGLYVFVHARRYSDCLTDVGLFSWPSTCV